MNPWVLLFLDPAKKNHRRMGDNIPVGDRLNLQPILTVFESTFQIFPWRGKIFPAVNLPVCGIPKRQQFPLQKADSLGHRKTLRW